MKELPRDSFYSKMEIEILKILKERSLFGSLVYYDSYQTDDTYIIVTEYLGDYTVLKNTDAERNKAQIAELAVQLIASLEDIHKVGIAHRDIKPTNIMVDWTKVKSKYIDFGMSCYQDDCNRSFTGGTPRFMYPKLLFEDHENSLDFFQQADRWSLAAVLYMLIVGQEIYNILARIMFPHMPYTKELILKIATLLTPTYYNTLLRNQAFVEFHNQYPAIGLKVQEWLLA